MSSNWTHRKKRKKSSSQRLPLKVLQKHRSKKYLDKKVHGNVNEPTRMDTQIKITPVKRLKLLEEKLSIVKAERDQYKQKLKQSKRQLDLSKRKLYLTQRDIAALVSFEDKENTHNLRLPKRDEYRSPLSVEITGNISIISPNSLSPTYMNAAYDFVKIRLKCLVLRSSNALRYLVNILNVYNLVMENGKHQISFSLGGDSSATVDRLMQHRTLQLLQFEIAIITQKKWTKNKSVMALYHDEMSFKQRSTESVVMAFNTDKQYTENGYNPALQSGNVVRAIWHRSLPLKDAKNTVEHAIKPSIDELDSIGSIVYENWIGLRKVMKPKLVTMSDQNTTALRTNKHIQSEFRVKILIELICLMHNIDNCLETVETRLLVEREGQRDQTLIEMQNIGIIVVANRIQQALMTRVNSNRNKSDMFGSFVANSQNKASFTPWQRVVGGRRQHLLINVIACMSRREEIGNFSKLQTGNTRIMMNPRTLFEFAYSSILLQESLVMENLNRMYIQPLILTVGRDVQIMNQIHPLITESFDHLKRVATNKLFALRTLLNLTQVLQHLNGKPVTILRNHKQNDALLLVKAIEQLDQFLMHNNPFDPQLFWNDIVQMLTREQDELFQDKYFYYLVRMNGTAIKRVIYQLQGVYNNVYRDLAQRYSLQSPNPPDSAFTTNDRCETLNACGKYYAKKNPNISDKVQGAHALADFNRGGWYTWDWLLQNQPDEFKRILLLWHRYCGTFRQAMKETKEYNHQMFLLKAAPRMMKLNTASEAIPAAKQRVAKSNLKQVIRTNFAPLRHRVWDYWVKQRDATLEMHKGLSIQRQRNTLKQILELILTRFNILQEVRRIGQGTGLEKKQCGLYMYCVHRNSLRRID
eukprot:137115_1